MKTVIVLLGSPYCGSTVVSELMATAAGVVSIGEAQRYRGFGQFNHVPEHYLDECSYCATKEPYSCYVWGDNSLADSRPIIERYDELVDRCHGDVVVDTSKEADWLAFLAAGSRHNICALLLARNPLNFLQSNMKRIPNQPAHWHLEGWCNIYNYSIKTLARASTPFIVGRYEDFIASPKSWAEKMFRGFGASKVVNPDAVTNTESHPLGGNLLQLARSSRFDIDQFKVLHAPYEDDFASRIVKEPTFEKKTGIVAEERKPVRRGDLELVIEATDVLEMASRLGYGKAEIYGYPVV